MKGKKYVDALKKIDKTKQYDMSEAIQTAIDIAPAKFDETLELHVKLGVDSRKADQQVRGVVVLPNGTGKTVRVLVIAKGAKADEATAAGADFVGAEEYIEKMQKENWFDFDVLVTTPDMMGLVGRLGDPDLCRSAKQTLGWPLLQHVCLAPLSPMQRHA